MSTGGNKAVFLDRDGTINVEKHYLYKIEDFEYLTGAVEGLKALSELGYLLVVITNQSGIARGYYAEGDYKKLDAWMKADLYDKGVRIAASYYCPHLPDGIVKEYAKDCNCRKPKTGLFFQACRELNIDMDKSIAIGDKPRDLSICEETGVTGILLSSDAQEVNGYIVCSNWYEVVEAVRSFNNGK